MSYVIVDLNSLVSDFLPAESNKEPSSQKILSTLVSWFDGIKSLYSSHEFIIVSEDADNFANSKNPLSASFAQIMLLWAKQHGAGVLNTPHNRNIDSIYSLSKLQDNSVIVSSDPRATIALVNNTSILKPMSSHTYTRNDLFDETGGLHPSDMPLFLSLIGSRDFGIEPIAGVKNSLELTRRSGGDFNAAIEIAKESKGFDFTQITKLQDKVRKNLLVSRIKEIQINEKNISTITDPSAKSKIDSFLSQSLARSASNRELPDYPVQYRMVSSTSDFEWLGQMFSKAPAYAINFEKDTNGIFAAVISFKEASTVIVPFSELLGQTQDREDVIDFIRNAVANHKNMVTFSAIETAKDFSNLGIQQYSIKADIASATYLLNTRDIITEASELGKDSKMPIPSMTEFCQREGGGFSSNTDPFKLFQLCSIRSDLVWKKSKSLFNEINSANLKEQYQAYEIPQSIICGKMGRHGLTIDLKRLTSYKEKINQELTSVNASITQIFGSEVDVATPADVGRILDHFQLATGKTGNGNRAINENELKAIANKHEIVPLIIKGRSIKNILSKQVDKIISATSDDGILRFNVHTNSTLTSRLSIRDPDLQNSTAELRGYMVAREGYTFVSFDYSQIEIRILADASGEKRLIDAFNSGKDVHIETASEVFQVDSSQVTEEQRKAAKAINFGLIYGMTPIGLSMKLGVSIAKANGYIQTYFKRMPAVLRFQQELLQSAQNTGFVELKTGRKIYFPEMASNNSSDKNAVERSCKNAPMQGTAAEIVKRAMVKADHMIKENDFDAKIVLQVHDELVFEVKTEQLKRFVPKAKESLESALPLSVPLVVDCSIGQTLNKKINKANELNSTPTLTI